MLEKNLPSYDDVLTSYLELKGGCIAIIDLNRPSFLNAINTLMAQHISSILKHIREEKNILAVLIRGNERAFSAGGDIKTLYQYIVDRNTINSEEYIDSAYPLISEIACFPKPVIGYCQGVAMGMGMGLFMACHYRFASSEAYFAMPESMIGIYPDGASSLFFHEIKPPSLAFLLYIFGIKISSSQSHSLGLIDAVISDKELLYKEHFLQKLTTSKYVNIDHYPDVVLCELQNLATMCVAPALEFMKKYDELHHKRKYISREYLSQVVKSLDMMQENLMQEKGSGLSSDAQNWWKKMQENIRYASPVASVISFVHLYETAKVIEISKNSISSTEQGKLLSGDIRAKNINTIIANEINLSKRIINCPCEMQEGVRALLIDKDLKPQWQFSSVSNIDIDWIFKHFFS